LNPWYIDLVEGFVQVFEKQSFIVCFQMQDSQASFFGRHTIVHAACGDLLSLISAPPPKDNVCGTYQSDEWLFCAS
jgi:hypothetical protein